LGRSLLSTGAGGMSAELEAEAEAEPEADAEAEAEAEGAAELEAEGAAELAGALAEGAVLLALALPADFATEADAVGALLEALAEVAG
jgi:hypothetical protein